MLLLGKINQGIAGHAPRVLVLGKQVLRAQEFPFCISAQCAHVNINNKNSYLQSDANMGLLKYLKDKATILYCLKQAENGREDLQHILNADQPPLPNSV